MDQIDNDDTKMITVQIMITLIMIINCDVADNK